MPVSGPSVSGTVLGSGRSGGTGFSCNDLTVDVFVGVFGSAVYSDFVEVLLRMEVISIIEVIEEIEVAGHSAECVVVNSDTLSGLNDTDVDLTRCNTLDCATCCTTEEHGACDAAGCTADLNE